MVHISFNTEELTITETQALVNLLAELANGMGFIPRVVEAPVVAKAEPVTQITEPVPTTNYREETGKAKRGRPKKEEATKLSDIDMSKFQPAAFPEPDPIPEPVIAQAVEKLANAIDEDTSVPAPTLDELRAALQAFAVKHGMAEGTALLQKYGVARVSEIMNLEVEKQHEFVVACNA